MTTKIQIRRGNAAAVPSLDVSEPGWDVDTKTFRVGDGTSNPPRLPTTKSTGSFDFSQVTDFRVPRMILDLGLATAVSLYFNPNDSTSGIYSPGTRQIAIATGGVNRALVSDTGVAITGNIAVSGTVDGVDISKLNPSSNGIVVKTADNAYAMRNLVPGNGMASFVSSAGAANSGGVVGDIIVAIANNPTIPGSAAIKVPSGTTGERSGVAAQVGHFRYNSTSKAFEGYIDGEWRSVVDYLEGKTVYVPTNYSSIQDAINYFSNRAARNNVVISLEAGTHSVGTALSPGSITTRISLQGANPTKIQLDTANPVEQVTGSPGNYLVKYKLASAIPSGITTDHSVIIRDITASGDNPNRSDIITGDSPISNTFRCTVPNTSLSRVVFASGITNVASLLSVNDYIMKSCNNNRPQIRRITSIVSTSTIEVNAAYPAGDSDRYQSFRKLVRLPGTFTATNSTTVTGVSSSLLTDANVGDLVYFFNSGVYAEIASISSNTSMTVTLPITIAADVGLSIACSDSHRGCWKISSIDTIANTVTVINTSYSSIAPIKNGVINGSITFCPSTILYTSDNFMSVQSSEYIHLNNLTIRYTGSAPTTNGHAIGAGGGAVVVLSNNVGFSGAGLQFNYGSNVWGASLIVSSVRNTSGYGVYVATNSALSLTELITSGNNTVGAYIAYSTIKATYAVACGNASIGIRTANSSFYGSAVRAHCNNSSGFYISENSYLITQTLDASNNTAIGLYCRYSSSVLVSGSGPCLITGNGDTASAANSNINLDSFCNLNLTSAVIAISQANSFVITHNSSAILSGVIIRGTLNNSLRVNFKSYVYVLDNSYLLADSSNSADSAISATLQSLVLVQSSYVKGNNFDAYASSQSGIYLLSCTGYTATSPVIDGAAANRNSLIATAI